MSKFKKGDKVIALSTKMCKINPREEGREYVVFATTTCPQCKDELICINDKSFASLRIKCSTCGSDGIRSNYAWTAASNFRSASYFDPYEELERAIQREDYMRAAELRDLINADHERQRK